MPRNAEGMLDDIGVAPEPAAAPEPAQTEPEPSSSEPPSQADVDERAAAKTDPANDPARPDGYIPKQALSRVQQELAQERQARERAEGNFQKFLDRWHQDQEQAQAQAQVSQREAEPKFEDPGQAPDPESDPMGWIVWRNRKDAFNEQQATVQHSQRVEQQRRADEFQGAVKSDVQAFKAQVSDYDDARLFYWNQRGPELMALGYSQDQAVAMIEQDERAIANLALQRRQSPAATLYKIAQTRGYQGKAAADPAAANAAPRENMAERELPDRAPNGQFLAAETERAARIKESQERNGSLSSAPGVPVEKMTAKEFAKFDEGRMWQEFDKMKGRKGSKEWDKSMGFR